MSDEFENESEESFGKVLAKSITTSVLGAAGAVIGLYAGGLAVSKLQELKEKRQAAKTTIEEV